MLLEERSVQLATGFDAVLFAAHKAGTSQPEEQPFVRADAIAQHLT
jgi:hypothetical protein